MLKELVKTPSFRAVLAEAQNIDWFGEEPPPLKRAFSGVREAEVAFREYLEDLEVPWKVLSMSNYLSVFIAELETDFSYSSPNLSAVSVEMEEKACSLARSFLKIFENLVSFKHLLVLVGDSWDSWNYSLEKWLAKELLIASANASIFSIFKKDWKEKAAGLQVTSIFTIEQSALMMREFRRLDKEEYLCGNSFKDSSSNYLNWASPLMMSRYLTSGKSTALYGLDEEMAKNELCYLSLLGEWETIIDSQSLKSYEEGVKSVGGGLIAPTLDDWHPITGLMVEVFEKIRLLDNPAF